MAARLAGSAKPALQRGAQKLPLQTRLRRPRRLRLPHSQGLLRSFPGSLRRVQARDVAKRDRPALAASRSQAADNSSGAMPSPSKRRASCTRSRLSSHLRWHHQSEVCGEMTYEKIAGGPELLAWFGQKPTFHDAEILSLSLNRTGVSKLTITAGSALMLLIKRDTASLISMQSSLSPSKILWTCSWMASATRT